MTDAPAVNGQSAYWVGMPSGGAESIILKWRYAPDGWAELVASKLAGDLRQTAHRMASALRIGGTQRLRFPFQLAGLPTRLTPTGSELGEGGAGPAWQATLDLNAQPDGQGPSLKVFAEPKPDGRRTNITIDGQPARRETFEGDHHGRPEYSDRLYVFDNGVQVNLYIDATSATHAAPFGPDGVVGIYRTITAHPDPASWTDQPVR